MPMANRYGGPEGPDTTQARLKRVCAGSCYGKGRRVLPLFACARCNMQMRTGKGRISRCAATRRRVG
ncbi:hypothetical protein KL86DES1_10517 [uncultured Desulfovibrio sp.]|uniref:Uncharacterized protein n=1 Tax=uncultured Desulfovibrio sp. TaxID=167968 RepID=A0A212KZD7_9BACT|nr:hypothetical protein KL86DES1_10517 [uncultured Desulfovibrio sp.]VZH32391.1 conserved protein of unknown function [Desulfovibrio sp. 86]